MTLLLICDRADISEKLTSVLAAWAETQSEKTARVYTASSSVEGRTLAQEHDCDVILLYSPLEGSLGDEPAVQLSRLTRASVVVITPEKVAGQMREKLAGKGVLLATAPLRKRPQRTHPRPSGGERTTSRETLRAEDNRTGETPAGRMPETQ